MRNQFHRWSPSAGETNGMRVIGNKMKAYIELIHPIAVLVWGVATLMFSIIADHGIHDFGTLTRMEIAVLFSQISIGTMNEYCDHHIDSVLKPWRPIPSGRVKPFAALMTSVSFLLLTFLCAVPFGLIGWSGVVVGTLAGLVHDWGLKKTWLSWAPFVIGYSIHPLWVWYVLGRYTDSMLILPILSAPFVVGLHFANQLPDFNESTLGSRGLIHRLGMSRALLITLVLLSLSPLVLGLPLLYTTWLAWPYKLFLWGCIIYWIALMAAVRMYLKRKMPEGLKIGFVVVEFASLLLISSWLAAMTWQ